MQVFDLQTVRNIANSARFRPKKSLTENTKAFCKDVFD